MAFVRLINEKGTVRTVPESVKKRFVDLLGYKEYAESEDTNFEEQQAENKKDTKDDKKIEKPLSEWTQEELKQYAEDNKIDLSGVKKKTEVLERIKRHMEG